MTAEADLGWIDRCRRAEEKWRGRARKVLELYRDENREEKDTSIRYNVLWANTEAMKPALYSQTPEPVVGQRLKAEDPLAKAICRVLEAELEYLIDCEEFSIEAKRVRDDMLLPGRGVIKVHYVPTMAYGDPPRIQVSPVYNDSGEVRAYSDGENEHLLAEQDEEGYYVQGESEEEVVDESVSWERVAWDLFVVDTQRCWGDVRKIAFGSYMDKGELKRYFGRKANKVEMLHDSTDIDEKNQGQGEMKYALVWEIWDKNKREVRCVSRGFDGYLSKEKDPLKLQGFFPTPEPMYAVRTNDTLVPIPLYTLYQDQARELDITTARLYTIINAMRVRGFYAGSEEAALKQLFASEDLELIPVTNFSQLASGGIEKLIAWLPIEQLMKAAVALNQHRMMLIESIYEITGMADILRGATDPRETKGAQVLKSQYASRRLVNPKQELEKYLRDLLRIAGEIVCEKFSAETITRQTGLPVTPEMKQVMSNDALRSYRIDIETDSTVAPDEQRDKEQAVEAVTALGQFMSLVAPLVQAGQMDQQVAAEAAKWFIRKFRMGRDLEDFLNQMGQKPPQPPRDVEAEAKAAAVQQKAQTDLQIAQAEMQLEMQKHQQEMQMEIEKFQLEMAMEKEKHQMEMQIAMIQATNQERRADEQSDAQVDATREVAGAEKGKKESEGKAAMGTAQAIGKMAESIGRPRKVLRDSKGDISGMQ